MVHIVSPTSGFRQVWRQNIFFFFYGGSPFVGKKKETKTFLSEIRTTRRQRRQCTWPTHTPVRYTLKTDTTVIQTVDSDCSKVIRQDMQEVCKTQEERDERVEKRWCEIELRGPHLKFAYYNGKHVWLYIQYPTCHWSPAWKKRRGTHWYIYIYILRWYIQYIYIYVRQVWRDN
jgi:hypothetical protein